MEKLFKLKENGTTVSTEVMAGITTFFAMAYIIAVNPNTLSQAGMEWGAVFLATIISAVVGTLIMGLVANVPYAQAPGMGLNAFFVYTVCFQLQFTWQQALSMVFICGLINIFITVTKTFDSGVPAIATLNQPVLWIFLIGLVLAAILTLKNVKGGILIAIIVTTILGIPFGVTTTTDTVSFSEALSALPSTFGVIFTSEGLPSLFSDLSRLPLVLITIFAFSMSDTFDTIGTFIGTGRRSGIFSEEDEKALETSSGFSSKMDKALFADATATSIGAIFGTSNTTTYVESAAGIGAGGRTGLTSVVTAICFALSAFLATFVSAIPSAATAPALIIVGCMMVSSFAEIDWSNLEDAIPAFFAGIFMALCYSISYGIASAFIFYCLIKIFKKQAKDIHPIIAGVALLFILNFVLLAII